MHVLDYVDLYVFPTGRRAFAQREIARRADEAKVAGIADHARAAVEHERATLQLELQRKSAGASVARFSPDTVKLDNQLDRAVSGLDSFLDSQVRMYGDDSDRGRAAGAIRQAIFPDSAGAITQLSYEQQSEAVGAFLERLGKPDLAKSIAQVPGLDENIDQVRARLEPYQKALAQDVTQAPTSERVRQMQTEGQELLAQSQVLILAHYIATKDVAVARKLLAPIERQSEAIRNSRRRRRQPTDIDPDTGEEVGQAELELTE